MRLGEAFWRACPQHRRAGRRSEGRRRAKQHHLTQAQMSRAEDQRQTATASSRTGDDIRQDHGVAVTPGPAFGNARNLRISSATSDSVGWDGRAAARALHDRAAIAKLSKSLFWRIFCDEPVSTSSENALAALSDHGPDSGVQRHSDRVRGRHTERREGIGSCRCEADPAFLVPYAAFITGTAAAPPFRSVEAGIKPQSRARSRCRRRRPSAAIYRGQA